MLSRLATDPARVTYSPMTQLLLLGQTGVVHCYVESNPAVQFIIWTKDRRPFDPYAAPNVMSLKNGSLLFHNVNQGNQGAYRCNPYNEHGTTGPSNIMEVLVQGTQQLHSMHLMSTFTF